MGNSDKVNNRKYVTSITWHDSNTEGLKLVGNDSYIGCSNTSLSVGEFTTFRYVDADSYDPNGWEVYFGTVISIELDPVDEHASIEVLCQDGKLRRFLDYETHYESPEEYFTRLGEARPLNYNAESQNPEGEEAGAP